MVSAYPKNNRNDALKGLSFTHFKRGMIMKTVYTMLLLVVLIGLSGCNQGTQPTLSNEQVIDVLNSCSTFEMGTAEPQQHFGKAFATGNEMCQWKAQQDGQPLKCALAGRVYAINSTQTGYGIWSCGRRVVQEGSHNGWALCCPLN